MMAIVEKNAIELPTEVNESAVSIVLVPGTASRVAIYSIIHVTSAYTMMYLY